MIRFLKSHPQFYTLYILAAFFCLVFTWFYTSGSHVMEKNRYAPGESSGAQVLLNSGFTPDGSNVTRSATQQLDALRMRVALSPDDTTHVIRLANMLRDAHQTAESVTYLNDYLMLHPTNRQAWLDLSQNLAELKRWEEAQQAAESMLTHYPEDPSGLYNLGAIHANQANIEEARAIWIGVAMQSADPSIAQMATASLERLNAFLKP